MAKITYNSISVGQIDDFCLSTQYQPLIPDPADPAQTIPNPETKLAYMERKGREYFAGQCAYGKKLARETARRAEDTADTTAVAFPVGSIV